MAFLFTLSLLEHFSIRTPEEETSAAAKDPYGKEKSQTSRYNKCISEAALLIFLLIIQLAVWKESLTSPEANTK